MGLPGLGKLLEARVKIAFLEGLGVRRKAGDGRIAWNLLPPAAFDTADPEWLEKGGPS